jgi:hypothetical protein
MKIIEALKKVKDLSRKADDLKKLVQDHCAISSVETEVYPDQKSKVSGWIHSHSDILKEILRLRLCIQRTNLETDVSIEIGGKSITKSIAGWIHRRRDLSQNELHMWLSLTDRGIKEGFAESPSGSQMELKIIRFYSPSERDEKIDLYRSEPMIIDSTLEVVNAVTDLIE